MFRSFREINEIHENERFVSTSSSSYNQDNEFDPDKRIDPVKQINNTTCNDNEFDPDKRI